MCRGERRQVLDLFPFVPCPREQAQRFYRTRAQGELRRRRLWRGARWWRVIDRQFQRIAYLVRDAGGDARDVWPSRIYELGLAIAHERRLAERQKDWTAAQAKGAGRG